MGAQALVAEAGAGHVTLGPMQFPRYAPILLALSLSTLAVGCGDPEENPPVEQPEVKSIPIAEARALPAGSQAKVEGFVTVVTGTFNSSTGEMGLAIQDDTAGIYVSLPESVTAGLGAKVTVTGKLAQMTQLTVIEAAPEDVSVGVETKDVAPKDLKTGAVDESNEGLLVRLTGQVTQAVKDDQPYGYNVFVDDGSGEVQVFVSIVGGAPVIDTPSIMMGQTIEVTGLSGQYEATREVLPRMASDLVSK